MRDIIAHAEAQAILRLQSGQLSGHWPPLQDPGELESESLLEDYTWSPDDVLCTICFSVIFKSLYFSWWLDERQSDRVEGK